VSSLGEADEFVAPKKGLARWPPKLDAVDVDGAYRIDARGGVPAGTYRVEVDALKKTGRKVVESFNAENIQVDEKKSVGSKSYGGESSPLTITVPTENGGRFDIDVPAASGR
jgi:hypothetical protein